MLCQGREGLRFVDRHVGEHLFRDVLANAADDHTRMVFQPQVRGKTDQFLLKFRKPR